MRLDLVRFISPISYRHKNLKIAQRKVGILLFLLHKSVRYKVVYFKKINILNVCLKIDSNYSFLSLEPKAQMTYYTPLPTYKAPLSQCSLTLNDKIKQQLWVS